MSLQQITEFLEAYKKRLHVAEGGRDELVEVLQRYIKTPIAKDICVVTKGVLTIRTGSTIKNELFIYKQDILEELKRLGRTDIVDIA